MIPKAEFLSARLLRKTTDERQTLSFQEERENIIPVADQKNRIKNPPCPIKRWAARIHTKRGDI